MEYRVVIAVHAETAFIVDTNSKREAKDEVHDNKMPPTLCTRCADKLEIGEFGRILSVEEINV